MISRYQKKPVVISACLWDGTNDSEIWDFAGQSVSYVNPVTGVVAIRTLGGLMLAQTGDYLIRGAKGEIYPCKSDIFELTYTKVEN